MSDADKLRAGLARIVGSEIEGLELMGPHTYRVTKVYPEGRCDLAPIEPRMEPLPKVDQWLGGGEVTTPVVGALCCVEFRDLKKDRPIITRWQPLRITGGKPTKAVLDATTIELAGSGPAVARVGDLVGGGLLAVAMVGPVPTFTYTPPGVGAVPVVGTSVTLSGSVIVTGSAKVTSG